MTAVRNSTRKPRAPAGWLALSLILAAGTGLTMADEAAQGGHHPTIRIIPATIEKTTSYSGCRVRIEGTVGTGTKAVIAIRGPERPETFTKKARLGPIWLSSGRVQVSSAPSVFLCFSAEPLDRMLSRQSINQYQLDGEAISRHMRIEPDPGPGDAVISANYLALRIREGRYRFAAGGFKTGDPAGGNTPFSLEFDWPKAAPSASYQVRLYEVRDGAVAGEASIPLEVRRVGFPAWIANLATNHSSQYGMLAVAFAAMAGFGIDFLVVRLFGKRRVAGH